MTTFLFKNNAISTLAGPISAVATTISVASGAGALFPSPTGGQVFSLTLVSASNPTLFEIVYCSAVSGDTLTVVRAREGTVGLSFSAGDIADHRLTAAALTSLVQSGNGFYVASDTGTANALVASVAGVSSLVAGQVYVVKKSSFSNTAATTINVNGLGAQSLVWADTTPLIAGDWPAGVTALAEYDGGQFNLISVMGPSVFARSANVAGNRLALFTSSGTWTVPAGVNVIYGKVWGAGGGGGGANSSTAAAAGGGGPGGYSEGAFSVTPGAVITITVGVGGAGGTNAPTSGSAGGSSSVGALCTATGGGGGGGPGGGGGSSGNGSGGALNTSGGGAGISQTYVSGSSYGGGFGGPGYGFSNNGPNIGGAGIGGQFPGGGGNGSSGNAYGGAGFRGEVRIYY